jgi:hypothetical protein
MRVINNNKIIKKTIIGGNQEYRRDPNYEDTNGTEPRKKDYLLGALEDPCSDFLIMATLFGIKLSLYTFSRLGTSRKRWDRGIVGLLIFSM